MHNVQVFSNSLLFPDRKIAVDQIIDDLHDLSAVVTKASLNMDEERAVMYIAGSVLRRFLRKVNCAECQDFLNTSTSTPPMNGSKRKSTMLRNSVWYVIMKL